MGIRKGWALCGVREERCFIRHAVSSHPLLELQTLGLSTLSSHHQDLPLDSVQKKKKKIISPKSLHPYLLDIFSSLFLKSSLLLHLPPACHPHLHRSSEDRNSSVAFIISFTFQEDEERKSQADCGGTCGQGAYTSSPCLLSSSLFFSFCSFSSLLTASLWISLLILHIQMIWEGREETGRPPPPPLPHLLLFSFPGWSRSGQMSRPTLRNPGHGVSLGKQRPGQQGFTQTLIILRVISGGSPCLYT